MIGQWHVNKQGEVGKCEAKIECQFGGMHGDSPESALEIYAKSQSLQKFSKMKKKPVQDEAKKIRTQIQQHISASQHKINGNTAIVVKDFRTLRNSRSKNTAIHNLNNKSDVMKLQKVDNSSDNMVKSIHALRELKK